jgi:hypothetical protein
MSILDVVAEIDREISRLQQAKELLTGTVVKRGPGRPGRPAGSTNSKPRRVLSAAARAKIAAAQRARWAKQKKSA